MTKQEFLARCDYLSMVHGVTLRAISALSNDELGFRPAPNMRSPRELIFHIYSQEKLLAEGMRQGQFSMESANASNPEGEPGASECSRLVTVDDARAYAMACHGVAEEVFRSMSD